MSTAATTPEVTIANSAEEIRAAMEAPVAPAPEAPPTTVGLAAPPAAPEPQPYTVSESPEGVEIKLETGAVYKGKTWQEAASALAKGKVEADKTLHQLKGQQAPVVPAPEVTPTAPSPILTDEEQQFVDYTDGLQAKRYGMSLDQYRQAISLAFETTQQTQHLNAIQAANAAYMDFAQSCPDYLDSTANAEILTEYLPPELIAQRRPPSADDLRRAHAMALYEKKYQPAVQAPGTPGRPPNPPAMPSSNAAQSVPEANPYTMPLDQLAKLI